MSKIFNIEFSDFIKKTKSTEVFNDELIVSSLDSMKENKRGTNMPPIRVNAVTFFLCTYGEMSVSVDYKTYCLKKGMSLQMSNLHILDNISVSSTFEGCMIAISPKLVQSILGEIQTIKKLAADAKQYQPLLQLEDEQIRYLTDVVARIRKILKASGHAFQNYILKNEVGTFLLEMANINLQRNEERAQAYEASHKEEIVQQFIRLILSHCKQQHEVSFYAKKLCITSGYLSRIMKTSSGKTAIKWISDALIAESKILLRRPNVNIQQVSDELHFGDQSSFGKFFKKHMGLTPMEYKNEIREVE
jgi:AraC-like DNA-binding protein